MLQKSGILTLLSVCVSFISAINQLIIARSFGSSPDLSSYLIASSIPLFIAGTIVVAFDYSLVPVLVNQIERPDILKVRSSLTTSIVVSSAAITFAGYLITLTYYSLPENHFGNSVFFLNLSLSYLLCFFQIVVGYLKCIANAHFKFIVPFLASSVPNLLVIISCLTLSGIIGTPSILIGLLCGNLIGLVVITLHLGKDIIWSFSQKFKWEADIQSYYQGLPLVFVGMLAFTVFSAIDIIWVPSLGESKLAYVNYCQKILATAGTLIIAGPSSILSPYLAKQLLDDTRDLFFKTIEKSIRLALLVSSFIAIYIVTYSEEIIQLLFERGNFTHFDTIGVSSTLSYFGIAVIPLVCVILIFRALMAKRDVISGAKIGLVCSISYFVFSGILKNFLDVQGIGLSYVLCWILALITGIRLLWISDMHILLTNHNAIFIIKLLLIDIIYCIVLFFVKTLKIFHFNPQIIENAFYLTIFFIVAVFTFVSLIFLFKVDEISLLKRIFLKIVKQDA